MEKRSPCGSGGCMTCPFSFNDEAFEVQNYGCLPDPIDIIKMKEESGHNWACHGDETKICGGLANYIKRYRPDLDIKKGNLISYDTWYRKGPEVAMYEADIRGEMQKLKDEIIRLRSINQMGCPACGDDCVSWVTDGKPCGTDFQ